MRAPLNVSIAVRAEIFATRSASRLANTLDFVSKLNEKDLKVNELEAKVKLLEDKYIFQENCYKLLERKIDDGEQYQRRRSLRINGIAGDSNESGADCLTKVKDEVRKLGVNVVDCEYDRSHTVGPKTDARVMPWVADK